METAVATISLVCGQILFFIETKWWFIRKQSVDHSLYEQRLITKEEYDEKRKGILKEFWINYRRNRYGSILALKSGIHCK